RADPLGAKIGLAHGRVGKPARPRQAAVGHGLVHRPAIDLLADAIGEAGAVAAPGLPRHLERGAAGSSRATPIWRMKASQNGSKLALGRAGLSSTAFSPGAPESTAPAPSST